MPCSNELTDKRTALLAIEELIKAKVTVENTARINALARSIKTVMNTCSDHRVLKQCAQVRLACGRKRTPHARLHIASGCSVSPQQPHCLVQQQRPTGDTCCQQHPVPHGLFRSPPPPPASAHTPVPYAVRKRARAHVATRRAQVTGSLVEQGGSLTADLVHREVVEALEQLRKYAHNASEQRRLAACYMLKELAGAHARQRGAPLRLLLALA